ncbi:MAG: NAD(P)-dependent alcohol dehydrogenase [Candidatus Accumulibacter sp.]|jgi:L-iditol 2-dehydrogenase|nr:NAD(P)-dependent alcohol dehydrogenase [Accumulibacter sp.]
MYAPRDMRIEERPRPVAKAGELLIKVHHVGICGSDMHFLKDGRLGNWVVDSPLILGHESAGEVVDIGAGVQGFAVGDKVALEPGVPCGSCRNCMTGHYNLCADMSFMAIPHERDGVFCEYVSHPAKMCFKLPAKVGTLEGGLCEPLSVGLYAVEKSGARLGQSAVIFGSGCIGLVTMMVLKAVGVSDVTVVDIVQKRLDKALELGARRVIRGDREDAVSTLMETGGCDVVFDAAGSVRTALQASQSVATNGAVVMIGMASEPVIGLDVGTMAARETRLETIFRYRNHYPTAIKAVESGVIPLKKIVSHVFPFEKIVESVLFNMDNPNEVVKGVVSFVDQA